MRRAPAVMPLAAAALALAPAPAHAAAVRHARDFEARVALRTGARTAAAGFLTAPVRAPRRFDLVGFRWRGPRSLTIAVRVRRLGGRWSDWVRLGDGDSPARASDPMWTGGSDVYQLRLSARPARLVAHFVTVPRRKHPAVARRASASAPAIIPRSSWDPNHDCDPTHAPTYGRVDMAFVHHTVNANTYSPADSASIVLAICRYHVRSNGWWDIGYNFLVDRYGQVFEGRAGGVTQPVVGAHAQGYNSVSFGVAALGTFSSASLPSVGVNALSRLVGWRLAVAGVPARGHITETSAGGADNRYRAGTRVRFARINGHRDGDSTTCPGDALYAQLPTIRALAAKAERSYGLQPVLTLVAAPTLITYPQRTVLGGSLRLPGDANGAASSPQVQVQRWTGSRWVEAGIALLEPDGTWSLRVGLSHSARLRALWDGGPTVASPPTGVSVRPRISVRVGSSRPAPRSLLRVSGSTSPWKARVTVIVSLRRGSRWTRYRHVAVRTSRGRYSAAVRVPRSGTARVMAVTAGDRRNAPGRSASLVVRVRRR